MNEGRAVINEGINLTKQKQAHDQLKIQLSVFFSPSSFPCTAHSSPAAPSQLNSCPQPFAHPWVALLASLRVNISAQLSVIFLL